jgi:hypothetical protein
MFSKEQALSHIQEIHATIEQTLTATLASAPVLAVGVLVTLIPGIEYFLGTYIDPLITTTEYELYVKFAYRIALYWLSSIVIARCVSTKAEDATQHPFIKKMFRAFTFYPLIPISTAAVLAHTGHSDLIAPFLLILIGSLHVIIGQFTSRVVTIVAWNWIVVGLAGIYLVNYNIPYMWQILVASQGLGFIIIGLYTRYTTGK